MFGHDFSVYVQYPPYQEKEMPNPLHYPVLGSPLSQASTSTRSSMSPYDDDGSSMNYFCDISSTKSNDWKPTDGMLLNDTSSSNAN